MKNLFKFGFLGLALTFAVAACNNAAQNEENTDSAADQIENQADAITENLEEVADSVQNEADSIVDSLENVQ